MKFPVVGKSYPLFFGLFLTNYQLNVLETNSKLQAVWFCDFKACYNRNDDEYHQQTDTNSKFTGGDPVYEIVF